MAPMFPPDSHIYIYNISENQQKPLPVQDHMFQTLVLPQQRAKARGEPVAGGIFALSAILEKGAALLWSGGNYLVWKIRDLRHIHFH